MNTLYDTSINIDMDIYEQLDYYSRITNLSKQEIIIKLLKHFIKKTVKSIFFARPTILYQAKGGVYKKLTLHLGPNEVELLKQISVVTLLSVSLILNVAMKLFGEKILSRLKNSNLVRKILSNFNIKVSYPEYSIFCNEITKSNRHILKSYEYS
jgi:hypothetical protein